MPETNRWPSALVCCIHFDGISERVLNARCSVLGANAGREHWWSRAASPYPAH